MSEEKATAVRKAISMLIDRGYIAENIGQTGQKVATSFVPYGMSDGNGGIFKSDEWKYPDQKSLGYYSDEYNAAEARKEATDLLKSVGYKFDENGKLSEDTPISFDYTINADSGHQAIAEAMQSDWASIGIKCKINTMEWSTFVAERKAGHTTVARDGWVADFNDPITMLDLIASDSLNNNVQLGKDPTNKSAPSNWEAFDALIQTAKTTTDYAERVNVLHEAEDMVMATYAAVPIYYYNDVFLQKTNVHGIYATPFGMKYFMFATVDPAK